MTWTFEPVTVALMVMSAVAYALGGRVAWLVESERRVLLGSMAAARARGARDALSGLVLFATVVCIASCTGRDAVRQEAATITGGDPDRGIIAIGRHGCGSCHDIPGVRSAHGTVGPPLGRIAVRTYLAGRLFNTPTNMLQWIQHPQHVDRGTAMPEMGVTDADARDIAAYLYTLR